MDRRMRLDEVSVLTARHLPGFIVESVSPIGEGLDNVAFEVNGELVVRRSKEEDVDGRTESIRREAGLLAVVARYTTLPVPEIVFTEPEAGVLAYRKLPGVPLSHLGGISIDRLSRTLGRQLGELHRVPIQEVVALVDRDRYPLVDWLEDAQRDFREIEGTLDLADRFAIEAFFAHPLPQEPTELVLCHNDFGAEHVLVAAGSGDIVGIIDWSDAAIADPAVDLALILRDLGPAALDLALVEYDGRFDESDRERAKFYARCKLLEDIAYGYRTGEQRYVENSLAHIDWVFRSSGG